MATPKTYTDIDVVNMALDAMGEDPVAVTALSSASTDTSKRARIMRTHYDAVKEAALTKTSWRFATSTSVSLSKLSGTPAKTKWAAAWQLPPDTLKVLTTWPPTNYEIQGKRILTNITSGLLVDYIRYVTEDQWPAWFVVYVKWKLVEATVKAITGSSMDREDKDSLSSAETDALSTDSQQQPNVTDQPNPFIDVRF